MRSRHVWPWLAIRSLLLVAITLLGAAGATQAQTQATQPGIKVLSSRPDSVSGGDAVLEVRLPTSVSTQQALIARNGVDVTSAFVAVDTMTLQGLVSGFNIGPNSVTVTARSDGRVIAKAMVQNWPIYGPVFAGPHQRPWICETEASGLGPPPASGPCVAPTRYDWFYRTTAGAFAPLPSLAPPFPANLAQTTTIDGNRVNYIVRVESGVINESIYRIAIIDDPTNPVSNPWSPGGKTPGPGWNRKLTYPFGAGAGPAFRSGSNAVTSALQDIPLRLGFAVAFGTRNTYGTGEDDVLSAETTMMIKERFIEQYGVPKFTIASGGSGGSIQQHYIAQNYPGLLDALTPDRSYSDLASIAIDVLDCRLLNNYFDNIANPANWPGSRRAAVDGAVPAISGSAIGSTVCQTGWSGLAKAWQWPIGDDPARGFSPVVPVALRYHPISNPTGARATWWDANVNALGRDPVTGFARSAYDNVGVQYGLNALNSGAITKTEFLDINERVGGLDIDGNIVPNRTTGDPVALQNAYRSGRVVAGTNVTLPIIDTRTYTDLIGDIHTRIRSFMFLDRMSRTNGTIANQVNWLMGGTALPDLATMALVAHNQWLENIAADLSTDPYAVKVIRNKPAALKDTCWFNGIAHEETFTLDPSAQCNQLMPIYSTVRLAAGGTLGGDMLKCQLKPVTVLDYTVSFTPAELVRLNMLFPQGVCDSSKSGISQQPIADSWLRYLPLAGSWARMGQASFGRD